MSSSPSAPSTQDSVPSRWAFPKLAATWLLPLISLALGGLLLMSFPLPGSLALLLKALPLAFAYRPVRTLLETQPQHRLCTSIQHHLRLQALVLALQELASLGFGLWVDPTTSTDSIRMGLGVLTVLGLAGHTVVALRARRAFAAAEA